MSDNTESGSADQAGPKMMECPYCSEQIRADAVTCRFCKRDLHNPNAPRLVLDETAWNTEVPEWMREAERKALARRMLIRKLRRNSWKIVAYTLTPVVLVIGWRVTHMPPDPHEAAWREAAQRKHRAGRSLPAGENVVSTQPTPKAVLSTPTPEATSAVSVPTQIASPTAEPTPLDAPTPSVAEQTQVSTTDTSSMAGVPVDRMPAYDMPASDLAREFLMTRQIAEDRYVGELIRVTGTVHNIDTTGNVPTFLIGDAKPYVKCLLPVGARKVLAVLRPGAQVAVHGRCDGAFVEILLSDCTIE